MAIAVLCNPYSDYVITFGFCKKHPHHAFGGAEVTEKFIYFPIDNYIIILYSHFVLMAY